MNSPLLKDFEYYLAHQAEMVEKYNGKYVVIKDCIVIGAYDDESSAVFETQKSHKIGTFLVQMVTPGDSAYTQTFHSRVAFAYCLPPHSIPLPLRQVASEMS